LYEKIGVEFKILAHLRRAKLGWGLVLPRTALRWFGGGIHVSRLTAKQKHTVKSLLAERAHTTKQCDIRRRRNTFDNPVQAVGAAQG